jgi:hypothetical protein
LTRKRVNFWREHEDFRRREAVSTIFYVGLAMKEGERAQERTAIVRPGTAIQVEGASSKLANDGQGVEDIADRGFV